MSKALEKAAKLQSKRLVYAAQVQKSVIDEFDVRYAPFVFGQPWLRTQEEAKDYFSKMGQSDDALRMKHGWDTTTFPLHGMMRSVMLPYLIANDPVFINRERRGAKAMERAKVDLYADLALQIWRECDATRECQRAVEDAFAYRLGWVKTIFDPRAMLPKHCWVDARDMLVDCETRSPKLADRRWVAEKMTLPIETAEWFAKNVWGNSKYEFEPVSFDVADDANIQKRSDPEDGGDIREADVDDSPTDFVRIVLVQVKGENPHTTTSNLSSKRMADQAGRDDVYDGKDHVLVMEARNGYMSCDGYKPIGRIDWPFPCKRGQFTYTPVALTKDNRSVYPYNIMQPGHSAQVATDIAIQAFNTDARISARRWFGYQSEAFQDEADAKQAILGDDAAVALALKSGHTPSTAIASGNFGSPNQHLNLMFAANRENYEAIEGMNKFDVQVRANQTALNTSIQNESAQVKLEDLASLVERAVVEIAEKGVMCARANMTVEDVAAWINVPTEVDGKPATSEMMTRGGDTVTVSELWSDRPDWHDIRTEVEVNLEPRSIRFNNPDKEAASIKELQDYQLQISRIIGDTVAKGGVAAAKEIARAANESMKMLAQLKNIPNVDRMLYDFNTFMPPEPSGDAKLQAEMQNAQMQGEITAQQQAAVTRLANQGVDTSTLPEQLQPE